MPDPRGVPNGVRRAFWRVFVQGGSVAEAASEVGVAERTAYFWVRKAGGMSPVCLREPGSHRLSIEDREQIAHGLAAGLSYTAIGRSIGRPTSTVTREIRLVMRHRRSRTVGCSGGLAGIDWHNDWEYSPTRGQLRAEQKAKRSKATKLSQCPRLRDEVQARLDRQDSPEQIAHRLPIDFPDDEQMRISHETIYVSLYVQGRGELRKDLHKQLRTGRAVRQPRRGLGQRPSGGCTIKGGINISERPAEADDRAVPGHWEGDLIMGKENKSAIGTLVERTTRFVLLLHLPDGHSASAVADAMTEAMSNMPATLRRTLAWDQGREMANHAQIAEATDLKVFFCDPASPWQRPSNENMNGLLRQYFPKGTDLSGYHPEYLAFVANRLNTRPRKTLNWLTPAETLDQLLSNPPQPRVAATT